MSIRTAESGWLAGLGFGVLYGVLFGGVISQLKPARTKLSLTES